MATKKTTETEVISEKERELQKALEEMRAEKEAILKENEELKEKKKPKKPVNSSYDPAYWNERVPYKAFYDGEEYSDDISVSVNEKRFLIRRGETVMIPRYVVDVLDNQAKQKRFSADYNRKLQEQFEKDTKKYLNE